MMKLKEWWKRSQAAAWAIAKAVAGTFVVIGNQLLSDTRVASLLPPTWLGGLLVGLAIVTYLAAPHE